MRPFPALQPACVCPQHKALENAANFARAFRQIFRRARKKTWTFKNRRYTIGAATLLIYFLQL
jgi:hypothetical protein